MTGALTETDDGIVMSLHLPPICCWRTAAADLWDRDYLDLVGQPITTVANGHGRSPSARCEPRSRRQPVHGLLQMERRMDEVSGDPHGGLLDDFVIEMTFAYDNGDDAALKAKPQRSSTAC
jgi:hypothetical protein